MGKKDALVESEAPQIAELLRSINQSQALDENKRNLKSVGGKDGVLSLLKSDGDGGIDSSSVESRKTLLGCNSLPSAPRASFWQLFVDTFDDATLQILIAAAIVSLVIGVYDDPATGYVEGCAILAACLIVSVVTAVNDYQKESQFRDLSKANDDIDVLVIRDGGKAKQISVADIVVGDIVTIEAGDRIPCDGLLVTYDGLELDESALTGEPLDIVKTHEEDPFVLSGCAATAGSATFVAIAVGKDSQWGIIKSKLEKEQEQTPLQEKLDDMAAMIGYVGMGAAAATFVAMMFIKIVVKPDYLEDVTVFHHALDAFIIGVTIVVVAVPEGLPLAVTIALAFSTKKMLADQNLIRVLAACETMGNATNICSDKTGTLTENRMTVVRGWFADTKDDNTASPTAKASLSPKALTTILDGFACCSTARIVPADQIDGPVEDTRPKVIGNKTEGALLLLAQSKWGGEDDIDARRAAARFGKESRLFPFSSARKRMSVLVTKDSSKTFTLYHKGAAEALLENCTSFMDADGSEKPLTPAKKQELEALIKEYASEALRCVAVCHRDNVHTLCDPANATVDDCAAKLEHKMCLDVIVGIADPLRKDVIEAVRVCQRAGIFVRMVTGDNLDTANAIAKQAGILTEGGMSMIGEDFRKLTPAELDKILPRLQVLARSSPEDKHVLVQRLNGGLIPEDEESWLEAHPGRSWAKEKDLLLPGHKEEWALSRGGVGEVVGVTGDGTNDGPALKAADVGLSMGMSGTDVAKKASDIIIMDDRFSSIVKAVLWGRSVFDNIRKFLQFQLTVNVVALTITFLSAVAGYKPPLNAVMMLWVNLIMDTMGALALGTEPPYDDLLDRRPYKRDASLISRPMWRNIFVQATYQLALLVFLLNKGPQLFGCEDGSTHHFTIIFNAFVFCQVFNEFNAREIGDLFDPMRKMGSSPMFLLVIFFTVISQYLIVEYGGDFTQTSPLTFQEWRITASLGAVSIPMGFVMRQIPVSEDPDSFAGVGGSIPKSKASFLGTLLAVLLPVLAAIVYQLTFEIEELKQ